ncbi:hypothetical protein [Streptomyces sp. I05A-00742]|uniref:hypothetical protein n=1 Tax=Streptomyces sp. I05A-00742 TaxID=2732853 RepID=UPI001489A2A4|nr:hypothetical protein [Streptomyces sp. I05A-00742]
MRKGPTMPQFRALPVHAVAVGALVLSALLLGPAAPAGAAAPAGCADVAGPEFPIASRLSGGSDVYERGADGPAWELELRNVTGAECRDVHPVAVLSDRNRALRPEHIRLEFYDKDGARWRPVRFERTEEAENVGVLGGDADGGPGGPAGKAPGGKGKASPGFRGFAVPAHRTVVVPLRLGFTEAAPEGPVTANVTAVQRRGADGAWVGESGDYTFAVGPAAVPAPAPVTPGPTPPAVPAPGQDPGPPVLAATGGSYAVPVLGALACVCLGGGVGLMLWARRMKR